VEHVWCSGMSELPYPRTQPEIARMLRVVDKRLLQCSERFIRQQVRKPIEGMLDKKDVIENKTAPADWLNVYSIYCANQQLSEACNKLWASIELASVTSERVWKKSYMPVGELFSDTFCMGTLIPTLYYAEISSIVSILSSFGCVPIMMNGRSHYLLRTKKGWSIANRGKYLKNVLGIDTHSWHDRILATYEGFVQRGVRLPNIPMDRVRSLRNLRNAMHYQILGDLKMWRMFKSVQSYQKHLPISIHMVRVAMKNLAAVKCITTGSDKRFENLIVNMDKKSETRPTI
jgi:hypothetical protein